jgi:hypothetical protein
LLNIKLEKGGNKMMKSMMKKMMPMMSGSIEKMDYVEKENMMDTMMPTMMNMMQQKGIDMFQMMKMMCPKCMSVATSNASEEEKSDLKSYMSKVFSNI